MTKKYLVIAALILVAGVAVYLLKAGKAGHPATGAGAAGSPSPSASAAPAAEKPVVEISSDSQQMIGVKTVAAEVKPLSKTIRAVGRIDYDERRVATVNTKYEGWIEKLYVDYTGKPVKKGEPLAEFYSPELYATQQELINAVKWRQSGGHETSRAGGGRDINVMLRKDAESLVSAARQRLRLWDLTDEQIRKIEETGKPIRTITLFSPVSGYVTQKAALQGMRVMPGEKLFDIVDLSTVWVMADVDEYDIPFVREGQTAAISLSYIPGKEFMSRIEYVYPTLSGETKTAKVRFSLPNRGAKLKPQMFTDVALKVGLGNRLVVPEEAVMDTGIRQVVYVDTGEESFEPREVMTGVRADGLVEVTRGLKAGEKVAATATFLIDSEAQLKGVKPLGLKK
ncbi:MAG: efflux RND transporter periplasmic adaptor subunit [Nitrospiraceae bacterium]|nr:efflux RND transporter periplasmic adaptor subunit [Nitrospiraceae bacterium]